MGLKPGMSSHTNNWRGTWAVITGASSGIGAEFARQLGRLGVNLVLAARRRARLEKLQEELTHQCGIHIVSVRVDLSTEDGAQRLYEQACANDRNICLLINNAGSGVYGPFAERKLENHLAALDLNTKALTALSHRFAGHMITHGQPSYITHVSSVAAYTAVPHYAVYAGTKAYIRYFSEALRVELRPHNIHVTCVCPGATSTEFHVQAQQQLTSFGQQSLMRSEKVVQHALRAMQRKRGVAIPGLHNKLACWLPRFVPERFTAQLALLVMQRAVTPQPSAAIVHDGSTTTDSASSSVSSSCLHHN